MKRLGCLGLAILLVAVLGQSALAWEYSMKGDAEWRYRYWTRTGNDDIFGQMDGQTVYLGLNHLLTFPTTGTTTVGSSTFGVLAGQNRYGADMSLTDYRATLYPVIRINRAISLAASVNLTSLGIWSDGQPYQSAGSTPGYVNSLYVPIGDRPAASDIPNTYVTLQWLKASIRTPMLDFSIGYKDSTIGMGLWKHRFVRASTSFGVSAQWGPIKIGISPYFSRNRSAWSLGGGATSRNEGASSVQRRDDRRNYFQAVLGEVEYSNGPMVIQVVSDSYRQPLSQTTDTRFGALNSGTIASDDVIRYRIATAVKYNNGRFFFNAEADWFNQWNTGRGVAPITAGGLTEPFVNRPVNVNENNNAWMYGVELGCLCGPGKITANYVRSTGDDPSTRFTSEDGATAEQGISSAYMKDWGYLMYWLYGTGTTWDADGYGQPTNLHHVGVRLDYAVASNLNLSAVYSNAWRDQPNAYRLGGDYVGGIRTFTNADIFTAQNGGFAGHAVPNDHRYVGWEVDVDIAWKLLENLTWNTKLAFWQPGNWWTAAFPDTAAVYRTIGGVALPAPAAANNAAGEVRATGRTDRGISPLFAVETSFLIPF